MPHNTLAASKHSSESNQSPMASLSAWQWTGQVLLAVAVIGLVFLLTAWLSHRHWLERATGTADTVSPTLQLVQGRLLRQDKNSQTYLSDSDHRVALALHTSPFDADTRPVIEVHLPRASSNRQYRLAWLSSQDKMPHFFILNQPVAGVSLTDLSLVDGWQGRIRQLGLIAEPLFPLGWAGEQKSPLTVGTVQWPQPDLWQTLRHQWHTWLSWQPPRYGDINHLPYSSQLPWYASPGAVLAIAMALLGGLAAFRKREGWLILPALLAGSLFMAVFNLIQVFHLQRWSQHASLQPGESQPVLSSDQPLKAVIAAIQQALQKKGTAGSQVVILGDDYAALRLYWYLLPHNAMWFPTWSEPMLATIHNGAIFLVPFHNKPLFAGLINSVQATTQPYEVTRAGEGWWLVSVNPSGEKRQ